MGKKEANGKEGSEWERRKRMGKKEANEKEGSE
jgi:hypothetical protein